MGIMLQVFMKRCAEVGEVPDNDLLAPLAAAFAAMNAEAAQAQAVALANRLLALEAAAGAVRLDGTSPPIHALNQSALQIADD